MSTAFILTTMVINRVSNAGLVINRVSVLASGPHTPPIFSGSTSPSGGRGGKLSIKVKAPW